VVSATGQIENRGSRPCSHVLVTLSLLDAGGRELGRGPAIAMVDAVAPGASVAFATLPLRVSASDGLSARAFRVTPAGIALPGR
jgi:hypothetical protein